MSRDKIAFVFFDNEEFLLLGSRLFKRKHKLLMEEKLLINFDCVSDGDNILLVASEQAQNSPEYDCLKKYFQENAAAFGKNTLFEKSSDAYYPSDQLGYPLGIGIVALNRSAVLGLHIERIHTRRDVIFNQTNIDFLTKCICDFSERAE